MEPHYRIDVVIRAFAKVQSAYPEARLALVGTGTCERENRDLASRLQLAQIDFKGRMPPSAMPRLYDENDIFINGSSVDNAPSSIIEAFSSGLAVASTDCGGISHLIQHEHTGLLSANGDWNALADNVIRILRDQVLARKMAENARIAAQRHEWRVVRRDWLALYEALIGFI